LDVDVAVKERPAAKDRNATTALLKGERYVDGLSFMAAHRGKTLYADNDVDS
jgi:hypothetical protein